MDIPAWISVDIHTCVDNWRLTSKNHGYQCWYPRNFLKSMYGYAMDSRTRETSYRFCLVGFCDSLHLGWKTRGTEHIGQSTLQNFLCATSLKIVRSKYMRWPIKISAVPGKVIRIGSSGRDRESNSKWSARLSPPILRTRGFLSSAADRLFSAAGAAAAAGTQVRPHCVSHAGGRSGALLSSSNQGLISEKPQILSLIPCYCTYFKKFSSKANTAFLILLPRWPQS